MTDAAGVAALIESPTCTPALPFVDRLRHREYLTGGEFFHQRPIVAPVTCGACVDAVTHQKINGLAAVSEGARHMPG